MDRWLAGLKGTLNLWDAHRVKVYNKEFRAEHPEYFDPDGILVFCGPQGSGKTLSMIQYAYRLSLAYPDMIICTNVELHDWPPVREIIQWEGMKSLSEVENGFAGVLFLIDEIQQNFEHFSIKVNQDQAYKLYQLSQLALLDSYSFETEVEEITGYISPKNKWKLEEFYD